MAESTPTVSAIHVMLSPVPNPHRDKHRQEDKAILSPRSAEEMAQTVCLRLCMNILWVRPGNKEQNETILF